MKLPDNYFELLESSLLQIPSKHPKRQKSQVLKWVLFSSSIAAALVLGFFMLVENPPEMGSDEYELYWFPGQEIVALEDINDTIIDSLSTEYAALLSSDFDYEWNTNIINTYEDFEF